MTRVLWGMPLALAFTISPLAYAQEIEVHEQPIEQPIEEQPSQEQPVTEPAEEQAPEQQTQPAEAQPPSQGPVPPAQPPEQQAQPQPQQQPQPQPQQQGQQQQPMTKTQLQFDQLPPAVQSAVRAEVGDGVIEDIEQDRERGQTVYEVEYIRGGVEHEADFAEDGRLLDRHED